MGVEPTARIAVWDRSSRWERSELGKDLRRLGLSYAEIMDLIPVKKSTLATWCREVRLTDEQYAAIKERTYGSRVGIPVDTNWKRHAEIALIKEGALLNAVILVDQPLWTAGTALYWGEGYKTNSTLGMANAEPAALRLFMRWTSVYHGQTAEFTARLNIHLTTTSREPGNGGPQNSESISGISLRPSSSRTGQVIARITLPTGCVQ